MCRFVYYQGLPIALADLLTRPEHSLIHQSFHSHERDEPLNGDGFGVAWFVAGDPLPGLFRSISPAWNNPNLLEVARVTRSARILAHVRAATGGLEVSEGNCHPFRMGGLTFMHNGDLGGFGVFRRRLLAGLTERSFRAIRGNTDSEHFLALLADAWQQRPATSQGADALADALDGAVVRVVELAESEGCREPIYLNCVVTDGEAAVACRFTTDLPGAADTLYVHLGKRYVCEAGAARMVPCPNGNTSVMVSSEPLTADEGWKPVDVGEMLLIGPDQEVRHRRVVAH